VPDSTISEAKAEITVDTAHHPEIKSNDETYLSYPSRLQNEEANEDFEKERGDIERRFTELLMALSEEIVQLSEFLIEEKKLIRELCMLLRDILRRMNMNFEIPIKAIPEFQTTVKKILLNSEGHLILMHESQKVNSKMLEDYPPHIVLAVVWNVIPDLERSLKIYGRRISQRVSIFEKIRKELKNIQRVFSSSEEKQEVLVIGNEELRNPISENTAGDKAQGPT
jgi:hypothetical protein